MRAIDLYSTPAIEAAQRLGYLSTAERNLDCCDACRFCARRGAGRKCTATHPTFHVEKHSICHFFDRKNLGTGQPKLNQAAK